MAGCRLPTAQPTDGLAIEAAVDQNQQVSSAAPAAAAAAAVEEIFVAD